MVKTRQRVLDNDLTNVYTVETRSRRRRAVHDLVAADKIRSGSIAATAVEIDTTTYDFITSISDSDDNEYRLPRKRRQQVLSASEDKMSKYGKRNSASSPITRLGGRQHVHLVDEEDHSREKSDSKMPSSESNASRSCSNHLFMNGNLKSSTVLRRSSRQKKLIYDNLNQTWLLASSIPELAKFDLFSSNKRIERVEKSVPKGAETRRSYELRKLNLSSPDIVTEFDDMYSRVKRQRRKTVRDLYARRISRNADATSDSEDSDQNESMDDDEGATDLEGIGVSGGEESQEEESSHPKYSLRPKKPITERFQFPIEPTRQKKSTSSGLLHSPPHMRHRECHLFRSPAHKSPLFKRKHHAIHNSSSTCTSSDDERHFEQRKARSMARARNRCLPMNFKEDDLKHGVLRDRTRIGCSLADVDPMEINRSIMFDSIGGLDHNIRSLKEMIIFPLLYPEVFEKFKITPPRGVLFHGPPGTGKTLVARALANECSQGDRRIAFFMRKGADCLSKWVGESERQLRLLFDQAYSLRPSIIFFDEVDGLAPVRSTRQDQIHSSIVSTLLALMDGLDSRGELVVIGATNRIDAIDPALRRPGRFDRELHFPLPSLEARCRILKIHTKEWNPSLSEKFAYELALGCSGYCGADLKALCTEAALLCLRRHYPQIYKSRQKLVLDVNSIQILPRDFYKAMRKIIPVTQRSASSPARPLLSIVKPLLQSALCKVVKILEQIFPAGTKYISDMDSRQTTYSFAGEEISSDEEIDNTCSNFEIGDGGCQKENQTYLHQISCNGARFSQLNQPPSHRPRLLLSGKKDQGQSIHLAPSILHYLEHIPVHKLDLPALYAGTYRTPEEACEQIFREAQRNLPSIIYLPHFGRTWKTLSETVQETFFTLLHDLESCAPLLILATSDCPFHDLPLQVQEMFDSCRKEVLKMENPTSNERREFFSLLLLQKVLFPPKQKSKQGKLPPLPVAPPPEPRNLTDVELQRLRQQEEATLTELRIFLRTILTKLAKDRKFAIFAKPVDPTIVEKRCFRGLHTSSTGRASAKCSFPTGWGPSHQYSAVHNTQDAFFPNHWIDCGGPIEWAHRLPNVPDYLEVIKNPMDLETMMAKIDLHQYQTVSEFLGDIDRICINALEYNPIREPSDRLIRHRACALKDTAHALVDSELDEQFESMCRDVHEARLKRGELNNFIPKSYQMLSKSVSDNPAARSTAVSSIPTTEACSAATTVTQPSYATRSSMRHQRAETSLSNIDIAKKNGPTCGRPSSFSVVRRRKSAWFGSRTFYRRPLHCSKSDPPKLQNDEKLCKDASDLSSPIVKPDNSLVNEDVNNHFDGNHINNSVYGEEACDEVEVGISAKQTYNNHLTTNNLSQRLDDAVEEDSITHSPEMTSKDSSGLSTSPCATENFCDKSSVEDSYSKAFGSSYFICEEQGNDKPNLLSNENVDPNGKLSAAVDSSQNENPTIISQNETVEEIIPKKVTIDQEGLQRLLNKLVTITDDWPLDALEKSYRVLDYCIYKHRQEWDKELLIKEMEREVEKLSCMSPS